MNDMSEHDYVVGAGMTPSEYGSGVKNHDGAVVLRTKEVQTVGRIAIAMAERWGVVAALPDGEDSAGRQKLRCMTADELATVACDTAHALWKQFNERGWLLDIPLPTKRKTKEQEEA